jgi:NAD(P)-dependent dehydrogenase (short-subunit alcohol dehydrogenase family)
MNLPLEGQVALVTGGAAGIGRAITDTLAAAGASGLVFDVKEPADPLPEGFEALTGDVTVEDDVRGAVEAVFDRHRRLDIVIANAGVVPGWSESEHVDLGEWDRVFAINVRGVMATIKHSVAAMKQWGGAIVVMGSLNSQRAHPRQCLYTATKHAVLGIVRATALDLGRYGIRVNAIGPGPIATDALLERIETRAASGEPPADEVLKGFDNDAALGRIATVDDVARTALFLSSPASAGITGQILPVDGGLP